MIEFVGLDDIKQELSYNSDLSSVDKSLVNAIKNNLKKGIDKKFIRRTSFNYAPNVSDINGYIRVRWQKKINEPFIGGITGRLKRSISVEVDKLNDGYLIKVVSDVPYARIQEQGGIVRKRRNKLTIPVNKKAYFTSANKLKDSVASKRFIFKKIGNKVYKPMYMLVDKVKLDKHEFVKSTIMDNFLLQTIDKSFKVNMFNSR